MKLLHGENRRDFNKKTKEEKIHNEILEKLHSILTCLQKEEFKESLFESEHNEFLELVQNKYSAKYYTFAYNSLAGLINEKIDKFDWPILKIAKLSRQKNKGHFRNEKWFIKFNLISQWEKCWRDNLYDLFKEKISKNELLANIAISAICYGGLNHPQYIHTLINTLKTNDKPLFFGNHYWIDLYVYENNFDKNHEIDEEKVHVRRWYPDNFSLTLINNYLNNHELSEDQIDLEGLTHVIKDWMLKVSNRYSVGLNKSFIKNLKELCNIGIGISEFSSDVEINQTLVNYARGDIKSASLSPEYMKNVLNDKYELLKGSHASKKPKSKEKVRQSFLTELLKTIEPKDEKIKTKTKSKEEVIRILRGSKTSNQAEYILVSWIIYHLTEKKNQLSTLKGYCQKIAHDWINIPDKAFEIPEELEQIYIELLDDAVKGYYGRLKDIHNYGTKLKKICELDFFEKCEYKEVNISTSFVTEKFFFEFIKQLFSINNFSANKELNIIFYIIAYRTGLRVSEILKIRIRDIELNHQDENDIWLYVTVNQYGTSKSASAYRKFPIGYLLTKSENKLLRKYITLKKSKPGVKMSSPLFGYDFYPSYGLTPSPINRVTRRYLTEKYVSRITMHSFRHTALSKLHIILSDNKYLIDFLTCYSPRQIQLIQQSFNHKGKNTFWNIGSLAGHNSPETTFRHYLHFTDFLLYDALKRPNQTLDYKSFWKITGCNHQYLTGKVQKDKNNKIKLSNTYEILKSSLKKFTQKVKVAKRNNYEISSVINKHAENNIKPQDCYLILKLIEQGLSADELANKLRISQSIINSWLNATTFIAGIKTQLKNPRHYRTKRLAGQCLAPTRPQAKIEIAESDDLCDFYAFLNKKELYQALRYFILNSVITRPGIIFKNFDDLDNFLNVISNYFKKSRIRIILNLTAAKAKNLTINQQENQWNNIVRKRANVIRGENLKSTRYYPYGKATLSIKHKREIALKKERKKVKNYHTNSLKFAFHLLAIMHFSELDLPPEIDAGS